MLLLVVYYVGSMFYALEMYGIS